jgi:predicted acetyltransferase
MTQFASSGADRPHPHPDPRLDPRLDPGLDPLPDPGPYPIRPISPDEFDAFNLVDEHAFHGGPPSDSDRELTLERFEFDRSLVAVDGSTFVGNAGAYSFQLSVPGQEVLPAAGVTYVAVLPTYRRRGVLSSLMRYQLADIRRRGESLAVLWASEAAIYSRFGYGRATWSLAFTVKRGEGALAKTVHTDPGLSLRIAEPAAVLPELAKVHDSVLPSRPGFFARNQAWWRRATYDPSDHRHGASPLRCLLAEDDGGPRGYALYAGQGRAEEMFIPGDLITVRELMAVDAQASAALWTDLLSRDLTSEFTAQRRPVDDPLLQQLADPRRARPQLADAMWVRIVDVPAALAGRRYSAPVDLVIEVRDDIFEPNAGRWRLSTQASDSSGLAGPAGLAASCVPAEPADAADLALDVTQLGAAYLGGTRIGALAEAGLVTELRPGSGAVRQLSAAMAWDPAPWCPIVF